jgi:hypothetical protein
LIVIIVAAAGVVARNVFGKQNPEGSASGPAASQSSPSSSLSESSQPPLRAEVVPFSVVHSTFPSPTAVVPLAREKLPRPPAIAGKGSQRFLAWAHDLGGADAEQTQVSFVLRSDLTAPVIVANVRVVVQERRPAMRGTWLKPAQAGDLPERVIEIDLDTDPPTVKRTAYQGDPSWKFPLQVSNQDPELFTVIAKANQSFCFWKLEVDYLVEGRQHTLTVDNDRQPFRTTGVKNVTGEAFVPQTDTEPWP